MESVRDNAIAAGGTGSFREHGKPGAVLFVHGILGNPDIFGFLRPLVPEGWGAEMLLLEGHGGTAEDFGRATMTGWNRQVDKAVERLRAVYGRVYITAHSMGTLFAIRKGVEGLAEGLFLMNPPLRLSFTHRLFLTPLLVQLGLTDDRLAEAAKAACGVAPTWNPLSYVGWVPRYLELFGEIRRVQQMAGRLEVPARVFFGARDEMVSVTSARYFGENGMVTTETLGGSAHFYFSENDRLTLQRAFAEMLGV